MRRKEAERLHDRISDARKDARADAEKLCKRLTKLEIGVNGSPDTIDSLGGYPLNFFDDKDKSVIRTLTKLTREVTELKDALDQERRRNEHACYQCGSMEDLKYVEVKAGDEFQLATTHRFCSKCRKAIGIPPRTPQPGSPEHRQSPRTPSPGTCDSEP